MKILKIALLVCLPVSIAAAYLPNPELSFLSGPYLGAQGGYAYIKDKTALKSKYEHSIVGGAYLGYGHVFRRSNLSYLALEAGFNYRSKYNKGGVTINTQGGISLDLLPGVFYDDAHATLIYGRVGASGDRFKVSGPGMKKKSKNRIFLRVGGGIEQEMTNNFYLRADYVFSIPNGTMRYKGYSSKVYFHTFTIGVDYRF